MENKNYNEFLEITGESSNFVEEINAFLLGSNCKREIKTAKSGFIVSYLLQETKKTLATFICRKSGVKLRIYPSNLSKYESFLDTLSVKLKKDIINSSVCKRLIDPNDCNPRCSMGYDFVMDNEHYQKCKYMAFMPTLTEENNPYIKEFLQKELSFQ